MRDPVPAAIPATLASAEAHAPLRVLAAEDNAVNQAVLTALLAQIGVEPILVKNGLEVVAAWESGQWDVILMDIQMPWMDGLSAARAIRDRETALGRAPTPIIAVTANATTYQPETYRAAGISDVVSKPIHVEALFGALLAAVTGPEIQSAARAAVG
ncbi:response regulator [Phenylobacterium sp.]|jgi:CheY-like chemotaxis protein|uniref:response regulator n=1 Tax=Phenylobacterium sp. TaxID=1871053 RepID=UPI002F410D05